MKIKMNYGLKKNIFDRDNDSNNSDSLTIRNKYSIKGKNLNKKQLL